MKKNKRSIIIIGTICTSCICIFIAVVFIIRYNFLLQYTPNGISRYIHISTDESTGKELIFDNSEYTIYTFQIKDAYFIDVYANEINLYEAMENKKITMEEMIEKGKLVYEKDDIKQYKFEQYQIFLDGNECIVTPYYTKMEDIL